MGQNRKPFVEMQPAPRPSIPVASETLRNGDSAPAACPPRGGEEKISVFWRVFGGTLLSIAALIVMTVYQQLSSNITDLRNAVVHVSETSADMVKKDDLNNRTTSIWNTLKEVTTQLPAMKTHDDILDSQFKTAEQERKELVNKLQALNERLVKLEALQAAAAARPAPTAKAH